MNKTSKTIIGILSILVIAMGGYIVYDLIKTNNSENAEQQEKQEGNNVEQNKNDKTDNPTQNDNENIKINCAGTYYGESSGTYASGISYNYKYEYKLYEDGTYELNVDNDGGEQGTYTISNNSITFTYRAIGSPETYKTTKTLNIASDCSYITTAEGFKLYRK